MIQNQELESTEMKSASALKFFEQTVNTMEPQGKPVELNQPRLPQAVPTPPPPPRSNPSMDGQGGKIEEQYIAPAKCGSAEAQAELLLDLGKANATFFHTPDGEAFASFSVGNRSETTRVKGNRFEQYLGMIFYRHTKKPPKAQAVKEAVATLEAEAIYDGTEFQIYTRYALHQGEIYIDLGDAVRTQIRITKGGCSMISSKDSPVKFCWNQGMAPLPLPNFQGSIDQLRQFLNLENESDWVMMVSWLVSCMRPEYPFPILVLQGEQGTAKSTTARLLRDLIDPSTVLSQSLPRSERDLVIAASKSWVINLDNLSSLSPEMSDAFCRISTGGGFRTRALYTDDNERLFNSTRPIIMNGISDFATRHDLADRSIIIQLPPIPKSKRVPEKELMRNWEKARPLIFGALCLSVSAALGNIDKVKLPILPRMADFATWGTAAEPSFGWKPGTFMQAHEDNRRRLLEITLDADPIAIAVIRFIQKQPAYEWSGTGSDLLRLMTMLSQDLASLKNWPRQPNVLSGRLRRVNASLREKGIEIEWTKSGDRKIHIHLNENAFQGTFDHVKPEINAQFPIAQPTSEMLEVPEYDGYEDELLV